MKFLIFITPFLLIPPFFEILNAIINHAPIFDNNIYFYFFYILTAITISVFTLASLKNNSKQSYLRKEYFSFDNFELITIALIGLVSLQFFINESVAGYSLIDFVIFSEEYRNGIYKGSGMYTVLLTQVLPTMLAVNIAFGTKFNRIFYFCLFLVCSATLILGARVFLLKIVLAFLFRISSGNFKYLRILLILFVLLFFLAIYKFLLDSNDIDDKSIFEYLLNPFTRLNFTTLANFRFGHGVEDTYCLIPTLHYSNECNGESFKLQYLSGHSKIATGFPNLSKYSGIAIPLPVYIYNIFGFLGIFITITLVLIIAATYTYAKASHASILKKILAFTFLISLVSAMIEDLLFLQFMDISIAIVLIMFSLRKLNIYTTRIRLI